MRLALVMLLLGGCRQILGLHDPDLAHTDAEVTNDGDGSPAVDARLDTDNHLCFHRPEIDLDGCVDPPTMPLTVTSSFSFNTDTGVLCDATFSGACVVALTSLSISAGVTVPVTGNRTLVILVQNDVTIDGAIDASSHRTGAAGPNASATSCNGGTNPTNSGGAAGGSFGTLGGDGGRSGNGQPGGMTNPIPAISFRGGCPGGVADQGTVALGGGAVALVAHGIVTLSATARIMANGAGAKGAQQQNRGGNGGGAGGIIVLDAPMITSSAEIFANGGGGGEGTSGIFPGADGGESTSPGSVGAGGAGASAGGDGGDGYPNAREGKDAQGGSGGGGGGGGGGGVILVYTNATAAIPSSPSAMVRPYN